MPSEENVKLREYKDLIEIIAKVEYQKFSHSHLIELPELINIGTHALYILFKNHKPEAYNSTYLSTAIKWAIRNEVRRRYKWYTLKNKQSSAEEDFDNEVELRADVYKKQRRYYLDASISTLSQYLTTNFKEDLNNYSANQLIQKYGTHILTDITIGGVYSMYYKSVIYESMSSEEKKKSVKGGATYLLNAIGLGISGSWDKTEIEKRYKKNSTWECNITITLPANQEPSISIDFGSWSASVDDTHSVLIDVDWNKTYPIYELISDPQKKEELKNATEDYIMSKSIEVLPTACVYRYYNGKDHYYTTVYKEAFDEWKFECTQFSIYTQKVENTIPLYQYWGDGDHFYTTKYFPNGVDNRKYENIVGYVFPSSQKGSIPLFRYWNSHLPNHFYTIYNSIFTDYIYEGIECYVLPNE